MNLHIKSAKVIDPNSAFNNQIVDIVIENGAILQIGTSLNSAYDVVEAQGQMVAPGFFDLNCNIGELGLETKEDIKSGSLAAAAGGFTGMAIMPNTQPPIHSKAQVEFITNKSGGNLVDIFPLGTISYNGEGNDMAEMYDMHLSGAKAFTDGNRPVQDAGLMERALLYAQGFGGLIFSYPEDRAIAGKAKVHEGEISTLLGMKGIPALAEELMIARDLYLAEYTNSPIHFTTISTAQSVNLIKKAKQKGLKVTCDVAAHHLVLTHEALLGFDSLYKVKPPLRTQADVEALLGGLQDDTIDAIVSQHTPHEIEFKNVEFEVAEYGITGLQTAFSLALQAGLSPQLITEKLAIGPRRLLSITIPSINEGEKANLVIYDVDAKWEFNKRNNYSKSVNSPFIDQQLTGKVLLTCNNNQLFTSN
jgi:dihydroorotase